VGQTAPPAAAPSLFVPGETGILSETYRAGGNNLFSFFRGGLQLQWTSRYRPVGDAEPEAAAGFFDTPPLFGIAPGPLRWLEQWTPAGGTRPVDDAARQRELEASLERTWLLFQESQVTPRQQRELAGG
jgi:hypothetical protein